MPLPSRQYADSVVVAPAGRIDHENCDEFRAALQPHVDAAARPGRGLVIDLSALDYVSSAGLRCFMLAAKQAKVQGGQVLLAGLRPMVAEIFQISRFNMLFGIFAGVREALETLSPEAASAFDRT